jgi:protocatechuate 3,4-dioxygenase alpha subunit
MALLTPFQTVGPYLHIGLRSGLGPIASTQPRVTIRGRVIDGKGDGIPDGVLEWWHPVLATVHRSMTGADGGFVFETVKPPPIDGPGRRPQAAHFAVRVLARGIQTQYVTRLYFADELSTALDPILAIVPEDRRHTLLAQRVSDSEYRFDVVVQGQNETVFFDI